MNLLQKLSSKNVFIFNLVLLGAIFGFSLAFLSFSCSPETGKAVKSAQAEEVPVKIPESSLAVAESIQETFRAVSEKVVPSVVQLKTVSVRKQQVPNFNGIPWEFFFGPDNGQERQDGGKNKKNEREFKAQGLGSGIIVRQDGGTYYVLTNNHVVSDGKEAVDEIIVESNDGKEHPAKLVGRDSRRDLAMVSFQSGEKYPLAVLGDSDAAAVGDWAIAVGNPLGFASSVTMGIISAKGRTGGPGDNINDFIQTDASINQGNSGGPLVNIRGEVIGINMWIASGNGGGSVGLGFSIPINNAKRTIEEFIQKGEISDGWLGVSLLDLEKDAAVIKDLGLEGRHGALAANIFIGSPAEKGGIRPGDFITAIDGNDVANINRLMRSVADLKAGETHTFTVIRDGKEQDFKVKIDVRKNDVASENSKLWPGALVHPADDDFRQAFKLSDGETGLVVYNVVDKSPAQIINLKAGDIIEEVNDVPVKTLSAFYKALREKTSKEFYLDIRRDGHSLETMKYKQP